MYVAMMFGSVVQLAVCEVVCSLLFLELHVLSAPPEMAGEYEEDWKYWKLSYGKHYSTVEEEMERYNIWRENLLYIEDHNLEAGVHGFRLRMNALGDQVRFTPWPCHTCFHQACSYVGC